MGDVLHPTDTYGERIYWLVNFSWGGHEYHVSTDDVDVVDSDGNSLHYQSGISEIDWSNSGGEAGGDADFQGITLEITLQGVDVPALVEAGHDIAGARVTVSRWTPSIAYADRQVVSKGYAIDPTYGAKDEPITLTVQGGAIPWTVPTVWPDTSAVVDDTTWPNHESAYATRVYPLIIGRPGRLDDGTNRTGGSPGLVVDTSPPTGDAWLLVAGHSVAADQVDVIDQSDATRMWRTHTVYQTTDGLGRVVSYVILEAGTTPYVEDHEYYVSWGYGSRLGGLTGTDGNEVRAAADVLAELLRRTSAGCDTGRTLATRDLLRAFQVDAYIDEAVDPWDWIRAHLLPILPISIIQGPEGAYPLVWQFTAMAADARYHMDTDRLDMDRDGPVETGSVLDVVNEIRLDYGISASSGNYKRSVLLSGDPDLWRSGYAYTDTRVRASYTRYGTLAQSLSTDVVFDAGTAYAVVAWMAVAYGSPPRRVTYQIPASHPLAPGDVVSITDAELAFASKPALVEDVSDSDEGYRTARMRILP